MEILMMAGPLRNGAERGKGTAWHAVERGRSLCGRFPKIDWSDWKPDDRKITCERCIKKLAHTKG